MKLSGFTFVRNAIRFDYPVVESIRSILPICDEFIVVVGNSDDDTLQLIRSINSTKIRIVHSVWDDSLRKGGKVLAIETDKALAEVAPDSDWAFYLQADEVIHERFHTTILEAMRRFKDDKSTEGLLFDYLHFYGDYRYIADSRRWYRREVRVVRPRIGVKSWKDAQGFRINGRPLKVRHCGASVFHYGWVKPPELQQAKQKTFHKLWHNDEWMEENIPDVVEFDYSSIDSVALFQGTHPEIMKDRIARQNWTVDIDPNRKQLSFRYRILLYIEQLTGWRVGEYRNYKLIK